MKQLVLGTAGHIDHGKTTLVKALTGIDTDRLKEEKARGITIELGFAFLDLDDGQRLGIVDVPGHEKFVKNMVAGAAGIDMVMLVIAADEGVMPQTREHLDICSLLGVSHGLVALTKADMVDEEWLELVTEDVHEFLQGTFLENASLIPVSSTTGQGLDKLKSELNRLASSLDERSSQGPFRLPVDRVFTMRGFGTVITGTAISGALEVGSEVAVYPSGVTAKVRGLQVHNQEVTVARRGQRTAINLQGLERETINRGDVVATPGALTPSLWLDLDLVTLAGMARPLKHRAPIRFHSGAAEVLGRIMLLDRDELIPGDAALCQVRLEEPVAVMAGDRFVLRSYSPVDTIAGGIVLHPYPGRHKRNRPAVMDQLSSLKQGDPAQRVAVHAKLAATRGLDPAELARLANLSAKELDAVISGMLSKRELVRYEKDSGRLLAGQVLEELVDHALQLLIAYHADNPLKPGMSREELKQRLGVEVDARLFHFLLQKLTGSNDVVAEKELLRLATHEVRLGGQEQALRQRLEKAYREGGVTPPNLKDLLRDKEETLARQVLKLMEADGEVVKLRGDMYYHGPTLDQLRQKLIDFLKENQKINAGQFKEITGLTRKYIIPLLEHFDKIQLTIRVGDDRMLRKKID